MTRLYIRVILFLWTWVLACLIIPGNASPSLYTFLHPGLWWLVAVGAAITFMFFIVSFAKQQHTHNHSGSRIGVIIKLFFIILPVPFIFEFGTAEYGEDALANRIAPQIIRAKGIKNFALRSKSSNADSVYSADLVELVYTPDKFVGKRAKAIGMIYRSTDLPKGYDYCFRYVMICCAADARPVGIFINKQDSIIIEKRGWYEIEGTVDTDSLDGLFVIKINDASIRKISKPDHTWLYPR